jgi:alkylation response protein AidB-like acyl-CoA dehydrogenase
LTFDLALSDEQEQLCDAYRSLFEKESDPETVREAEATGFSAPLWKRVRDLGAVDMAVAEAAGGAGATLLDVALVCEEAGAALAPIPLVEPIVVARMLAGIDSDAARALLSSLLAGDGLVTLALRPPVDGVIRWVPAGAIAGHVVLLDGDALRAVPIDGTERRSNLAALPVADCPVGDGGVVLLEGPGAADAYDRALGEWRALTASLLVGAGKRCIEIGVRYTTERHQFGVPIASFQTIAHRLADAHTGVDGAMLLSREAAWAADEDPARRDRLARMAFAFASQVAEQAAEEVLHFHGGYGFMLEYDIQLYFRRIKAWTLLLGDRQQELRQLGDLLWGDAERATT